MLLFTTILLIGAGFGFIKHVLSAREKRLFAFVISLQVCVGTYFVVHSIMMTRFWPTLLLFSWRTPEKALLAARERLLSCLVFDH